MSLNKLWSQVSFLHELRWCVQLRIQFGWYQNTIWINLSTIGLLPDTQKNRVSHAPGMLGKFSPPPTKKELANPDASRHMRDTRAVMHVGIATCGGGKKIFPAFPVHAQPAVLRIWYVRNQWSSAKHCCWTMSVSSIECTVIFAKSLSASDKFRILFHKCYIDCRLYLPAIQLDILKDFRQLITKKKNRYDATITDSLSIGTYFIVRKHITQR